MTPAKRSSPAHILTGFSLSLNITAERRMVTSGQAKMIESASGTSIKETQASEQMNDIEPVSPDKVTAFIDKIKDYELIMQTT